MIIRLLSAALVAGFLAAVVATGLQLALTSPLIIAAERYETQASAAPRLPSPASLIVRVHGGHDHGTKDPSVAGGEAAPDWQPGPGLPRMAFTALATLVGGVGYALLLGAVLARLRPRADPRDAACASPSAGFLAVALAPALGLPPELPGMEAAPLADRQFWWVMTAAATAMGLYLIAIRRAPITIAGGIVLLVAPASRRRAGGEPRRLEPAGGLRRAVRRALARHRLRVLGGDRAGLWLGLAACSAEAAAGPCLRPTPVTLYVCATCRAAGDAAEPARRRPPARRPAGRRERRRPPGHHGRERRMPLGLQAALHRGGGLGRAAGPTSTATSTRSPPPRTILDGVGALCRDAGRHRAVEGAAPGIPQGRRRPHPAVSAARGAPPSRTPPNDPRRQDPLHHRHRLPRGRQDHAGAPPRGERRRPAPRHHRQRVRRHRLRRLVPGRLRRRGLRRRGHRRARQRLHLLHRGRRLRAGPEQAPRPGRSARAHPDRDLGPRPAEAPGPGLPVAGDPLAGDGGRRRRGRRRPRRGRGPLRRRPGGARPPSAPRTPASTTTTRWRRCSRTSSSAPTSW